VPPKATAMSGMVRMVALAFMRWRACGSLGSRKFRACVEFGEGAAVQAEDYVGVKQEVVGGWKLRMYSYLGWRLVGWSVG